MSSIACPSFSSSSSSSSAATAISKHFASSSYESPRSSSSPTSSSSSWWPSAHSIPVELWAPILECLERKDSYGSVCTQWNAAFHRHTHQLQIPLPQWTKFGLYAKLRRVSGLRIDLRPLRMRQVPTDKLPPATTRRRGYNERWFDAVAQQVVEVLEAPFGHIRDMYIQTAFDPKEAALTYYSAQLCHKVLSGLRGFENCLRNLRCLTLECIHFNRPLACYFTADSAPCLETLGLVFCSLPVVGGRQGIRKNQLRLLPSLHSVYLHSLSYKEGSKSSSLANTFSQIASGEDEQRENPEFYIVQKQQALVRLHAVFVKVDSYIELAQLSCLKELCLVGGTGEEICMQEGVPDVLEVLNQYCTVPLLEVLQLRGFMWSQVPVPPNAAFVRPRLRNVELLHCEMKAEAFLLFSHMCRHAKTMMLGILPHFEEEFNSDHWDVAFEVWYDHLEELRIMCGPQSCEFGMQQDLAEYILMDHLPNMSKLHTFGVFSLMGPPKSTTDQEQYRSIVMICLDSLPSSVKTVEADSMRLDVLAKLPSSVRQLKGLRLTSPLLVGCSHYPLPEAHPRETASEDKIPVPVELIGLGLPHRARAYWSERIREFEGVQTLHIRIPDTGDQRREDILDLCGRFPALRELYLEVPSVGGAPRYVSTKRKRLREGGEGLHKLVSELPASTAAAPIASPSTSSSTSSTVVVSPSPPSSSSSSTSTCVVSDSLVTSCSGVSTTSGGGGAIGRPPKRRKSRNSVEEAAGPSVSSSSSLSSSSSTSHSLFPCGCHCSNGVVHLMPSSSSSSGGLLLSPREARLPRVGGEGDGRTTMSFHGGVWRGCNGSGVSHMNFPSGVVTRARRRHLMSSSTSNSSSSSGSTNSNSAIDRNYFHVIGAVTRSRRALARAKLRNSTSSANDAKGDFSSFSITTNACCCAGGEGCCNSGSIINSRSSGPKNNKKGVRGFQREELRRFVSSQCPFLESLVIQEKILRHSLVGKTHIDVFRRDPTKTRMTSNFSGGKEGGENDENLSECKSISCRDIIGDGTCSSSSGGGDCGDIRKHNGSNIRYSSNSVGVFSCLDDGVCTKGGIVREDKSRSENNVWNNSNISLRSSRNCFASSDFGELNPEEFSRRNSSLEGGEVMEDGRAE